MKYVPLYLLILLFPVLGVADDSFPGRPLYRTVKVIELQALHDSKDNYHIVDVRSEYEYSTIHVKDSINIPLSDHSFLKQIHNLKKADNKPVAFYCNGHTCMKSYKATLKAQNNNTSDVYAFDAGIFDWANAYPDDSVLLGKSPVDTNKLISKDKFNSHLIEPEEFAAKATKEKAIILDVRDQLQREGVSLFPGRQKSIPLDNAALDEFISKSQTDKVSLAIYDATGKQVRWLQYYLEDKGVTDYYFMKGGAKGFYDAISNF